MDILKKIYVWIVWSSVNENKFSLTLKAIIPFIALLHFATPDTLLNAGNSIIDFLVVLGTVLTGIVTLVGATRKVGTSVKALFTGPEY